MTESSGPHVVADPIGRPWWTDPKIIVIGLVLGAPGIGGAFGGLVSRSDSAQLEANSKKLAIIEAKLTQTIDWQARSDERIGEFWRRTMPGFEGRLTDHENRVRTLELALAKYEAIKGRR